MGRTKPALVGAGVVIGMLGQMAGSALAAGGTPPIFFVEIDSCVSGAAPSSPGRRIEVTWQNSNRATKAHFTTTTDQNGGWAPPPATCDTIKVRSGDRFIAHVTRPQDQTRTFVVPTLDATFNGTSNKISGHGPKSSVVNLDLHHGSLDGDYVIYPACQASPTTNASGGFTFDASVCDSYDPTGGDAASLFWQSGQGDIVTRVVYAPYLLARPQSPLLQGYSTPGLAVTINLTDARGTLRASGTTTASATGSFSVNLRNGAGNAVPIIPSDRLSGNWADLTSVAVPHMTVIWDLAANTVTGICMPNAPFALRHAFSGGPSIDYGVTDAQGSTGAKSMYGNPLASGDHVVFTCARPSGDRFRIAKAVP